METASSFETSIRQYSVVNQNITIKTVTKINTQLLFCVIFLQMYNCSFNSVNALLGLYCHQLHKITYVVEKKSP